VIILVFDIFYRADTIPTKQFCRRAGCVLTYILAFPRSNLGRAAVTDVKVIP
jgi:hypothetical protein